MDQRLLFWKSSSKSPHNHCSHQAHVFSLLIPHAVWPTPEPFSLYLAQVVLLASRVPLGIRLDLLS